jgi:hypothetical protein
MFARISANDDDDDDVLRAASVVDTIAVPASVSQVATVQTQCDHFLCMFC